VRRNATPAGRGSPLPAREAPRGRLRRHPQDASSTSLHIKTAPYGWSAFCVEHHVPWRTKAQSLSRWDPPPGPPRRKAHAPARSLCGAEPKPRLESGQASRLLREQLPVELPPARRPPVSRAMPCRRGRRGKKGVALDHIPPQGARRDCPAASASAPLAAGAAAARTAAAGAASPSATRAPGTRAAPGCARRARARGSGP